MSYVLTIPFLFAYLIYRKRKTIRASISFESSSSPRKIFPYKEIVGALLFFMAVLTYWYGSYKFTPLEFHMVAFPIFVTACTLIMFNIQILRQLAFPILFLLFLIPPPLQIAYQAGAALSTSSSQATYSILKTFGLPVSLATQYGNPVIILQKAEGPLTFAVDIACSGIYSLIGFLIFTTFIAYIARTSLWKKATIFLTGFPLIYALNILRITIIVLIGNYSGMDLATQTFHLLGGLFLIFIGTLLLLTISEKLFKIRLFTSKPKSTSCSYCNQNPEDELHFCPACGKLLNFSNVQLSKRDICKIAILIISAILIINIQVPVFALTKGPAEVTVQTLGSEQATTQILPEIAGYATKFIYRDTEFEGISQQDASLTYAYIPANRAGTTIFTAIEIAKARYVLHPWEVCLITWPQIQGRQPSIAQLSLRDVQLLENPPITARYFAFQDSETNTTQVILYWYENAIFNIGSTQEQRHVKISLITFVNDLKDISSIEEQLLQFGKAIANYWQPIKTWSKITLIISQNGATLITITITLLTIALVFQSMKNRKEKKSNLQVYKKLALKEERLILQATHAANREDKSTGIAIASHYQKLARKPIALNVLIQKLDEAYKAGLVKREIANREDEPILVWKPRISFK